MAKELKTKANTLSFPGSAEFSRDLAVVLSSQF